MGRKNKLQKFADILRFPNVYECYDTQSPTLVSSNMEPVDLKGKWNSQHFKNNQPITLELACGGGEYCIGMGTIFPDRNFIGVDVKGNRLWKGAKEALDAKLHNVAFLRTRIEVIEQFFDTDEVSEIWITFADPFPRPTKVNRRLTSPLFIGKYRQILESNGLVHLKHDDPDFYKFSKKVAEADPLCKILYTNEDIYASELLYPELNIKTIYEEKHLKNGKTIKYIRYQIH